MSDAVRRLWALIGLAVLVGLATDARAQPAAVEIATDAHIPIAPGKTIEFRAVNGEASFLPALDAQAVIEYARDVPADVKIVTLTTPEGVTVCTVYASSNPKTPTECLPNGKGRLAAGKVNDQSRVRFRIRVPAGVHVSATINQGDLKAMGIVGNLRLYSNNGYVLVHDGGGPGTIQAGTGLLGDVDAVIANAQNGPTARDIRLATIGSGRVRVAMPTTISASYKIATNAAAEFARIFHVEKVAPPVLIGSVGPPGASRIRLDVDTGIAGRFIMLPAK